MIDVERAVRANRTYLARWGHREEIAVFLGFDDVTPTEEVLAEAVATWQGENGLGVDGIVGPRTWAALAAALGLGGPATPPAGPAGSGLRTTQALRQAWQEDECEQGRMSDVVILGRRTPVNRRTVDAWPRLEQALLDGGYVVQQSVWAYNCRDIKGSSGRSLHAYGIAVDIDPVLNPFRKTEDRRGIRFADGSDPADRAAQVRSGAADTVFTPEQVAAVEAVRTADGLQLFAWGGRWGTVKDAMHFQINVTPAELSRGLSP